MNDEMVAPTGHNEIFKRIMDDYGVLIKDLMAGTSAREAQVSGWRDGTRVIPIGAWACLKALTRDPRIDELLPDPFAPRRHAPPRDVRDLLSAMICAHEGLGDCLEAIDRIARDGHITGQDDRDISRFLTHGNELCKIFSLVAGQLVGARGAVA